jgi:hypothetical protein
VQGERVRAISAITSGCAGATARPCRPKASCIEASITSIFAKQDLPATDDDHRRVLAVLAFLRSA